MPYAILYHGPDPSKKPDRNGNRESFRFFWRYQFKDIAERRVEQLIEEGYSFNSFEIIGTDVYVMVQKDKKIEFVLGELDSKKGVYVAKKETKS